MEDREYQMKQRIRLEFPALILSVGFACAGVPIAHAQTSDTADDKSLVLAQLQPKLTPEQEAAKKKAEQQKQAPPPVVQQPPTAPQIQRLPSDLSRQRPSQSGQEGQRRSPTTIQQTPPPPALPKVVNPPTQTNVPTTPSILKDPQRRPSQVQRQPPASSTVPPLSAPTTGQSTSPAQTQQQPVVTPNTPSILKQGSRRQPPSTGAAIPKSPPVESQQQQVTTPNTPSILKEGSRRQTPSQQSTTVPTAAPRPGVVVPLAAGVAGAVGAGIAIKQFSDVQNNRRERVEDGGRRTIIQEPGNRTIIKQDNRIIIRHDETARFRGNATDVRSRRRPDGFNETIIVRKGGPTVVTVVDRDNRLVRRYRRDDRGREVNLIDNRRFYRNAALIGVGALAIGVALNLRSPVVRIPREKYIVDYAGASDDDLYEALDAPPIERLERSYSLDEIRNSYPLRERVRRVDLDTITFAFGAWEVAPEQFDKLERIAKVIKRVLARNPETVFLIEGHTDAVGSDTDNLSLSDRRAESVADVLSQAFEVPPENLVTQGYGEQHLKVPTAEAERLNRRVTILNITLLMAERQN